MVILLPLRYSEAGLKSMLDEVGPLGIVREQPTGIDTLIAGHARALAAALVTDHLRRVSAGSRALGRRLEPG